MKDQVAVPTWELYYCVTAAVFSVLASGFDIGAFSFAVVFLPEDPQLQLNSVQVGILAGMFNIIAAFGAAFAGPIYDALGRKVPMMLGNAMIAVGVVVLALAPDFNVMFIGRFIMGLGNGLSWAGPAMYCSELAPDHLRGRLTSLVELTVNFGILIGYLSGWLFAPDWRLFVGLGAILPVMTIILQLFILESPRWLVKMGKDELARAVIQRSVVVSKEKEDNEIASIKDQINSEQTASNGAIMELLFPSKALRQAMIIGWGVAFFQQANGSEGIVYFTPALLEQGGISPNSNALYGLTALVGLSKVTFILVGMFLVDVVGRRPLLITSAAGVVAGLAFISIAYVVQPPLIIIAAAGLSFFMASFSVGYGPLTGVFLGEVFPLGVRSTAIGIGWGINRLLSGIVAITFLPLTEAIGVSATFMVYITIAFVALVHSLTLVPETKGLSIEDIWIMFKQRAEDKSAAIENSHPSKSAANGKSV